MALVRWNPWQDLFNIEREMDALVRRMFDRSPLFPLARPENGTGQGWVPAIDVMTRGEDLVIRAELPGIDPERDVEITLEDNLLRLSGERRREERTEGEGTFRLESLYGRFERTVMLPDGVNPEDVQASYESGILEILVPGAARQRGVHKIQVQAGEGRKALGAPKTD